MLQNVFFIDDDKPTTIINERLAKRSKLFKHIKTFNLSETALDYLKSNKGNIDLFPCIIFLDINMPAFTGWKFLEEFKKIDFPKKIHIVMLSTTDVVDFELKEKFKNEINSFENKPLSIEKIIMHTKAIQP